ncbi:HNH endonuclease signature motif containing protein [Aureimonas altamirensis]|uniref:HNH endonuclease signature motif containing protein n=1 Tax=Aureimonas altamirensis TaxID=370622 RepID=UPI0025539027|nr:HNH endonuclease signature motif containing protein [Aureimonas altamirensis]
MSRWPYNTNHWRRLRFAKLAVQPLCEACLRREVVEPAAAVDHIIAIAKGGDAFPPLDGLMSLCTSCHNAKTNAVDHPNATGFRRALKGYDVDGNPIDPEGWSAPAATHGHDTAPGGFEGPERPGQRPAGSSKKDLVANHSQLEADLWV